MKDTHITWSIENSDRCPVCAGPTVLVTAPSGWVVDGQDEEEGEMAEVVEEITGHYCRECRRLVSLSLNTFR